MYFSILINFLYHTISFQNSPLFFSNNIISLHFLFTLHLQIPPTNRFNSLFHESDCQISGVFPQEGAIGQLGGQLFSDGAQAFQDHSFAWSFFPPKLNFLLTVEKHRQKPFHAFLHKDDLQLQYRDLVFISGEFSQCAYKIIFSVHGNCAQGSLAEAYRQGMIKIRIQTYLHHGL